MITPSSQRRRRAATRCTSAPRARPASSSPTGCASASPSATTAPPGVVLADDRRVAGELAGDELDALDLYRFTLARRSDLRVRLGTTKDFDLRLLSEGGRRLACSCGSAGAKELTRRLAPGRYFIAVRARDGEHGKYALSRLARTITPRDDARRR